MNHKPKPNSSSSELIRYAGLGGQIFISLGIAVFAGYKADHWLNTPFPILIWLLPVTVLCFMIYKMVKDTSNKINKDAGT